MRFEGVGKATPKRKVELVIGMGVENLHALKVQARTMRDDISWVSGGCGAIGG